MLVGEDKTGEGGQQQLMPAWKEREQVAKLACNFLKGGVPYRSNQVSSRLRRSEHLSTRHVPCLHQMLLHLLRHHGEDTRGRLVLRLLQRWLLLRNKRDPVL